MFASVSLLSEAAHTLSSLTTTNITVGSRVLFLPDEPGVYLALKIEPNEVLFSSNDSDFSETQSMNSQQQLFTSTFKSLALKK